jgi:prolyl 4-hydroxylase
MGYPQQALQVLYESHSVIHGRPFPLQGRFYANVFLHFEPVGSLDGGKMGINDNGAPHYIIPGSIWEDEWKLSNPDGWELVSDDDEQGFRFCV